MAKIQPEQQVEVRLVPRMDGMLEFIAAYRAMLTGMLRTLDQAAEDMRNLAQTIGDTDGEEHEVPGGRFPAGDPGEPDDGRGPGVAPSG